MIGWWQAGGLSVEWQNVLQTENSRIHFEVPDQVSAYPTIYAFK